MIIPGSIKQGELIRPGDESRDDFSQIKIGWRPLTAEERLFGTPFNPVTMHPIRRLDKIA